jgi:membrane fusion protein, copper/silver efflux system
MKYYLIYISFSFLIVMISSCKSSTNNDEHAMDDDTYYTCSMDPQVKESKGGKCPVCHMDLTPMKKEKSASNEISISEQQIKLGNIKTIVVSESSNALNDRYTGILTINQEKVNTIAAKAMGRIERLYHKTLGEYVSVNSPVYDIYSEPIAIIKQDLIVANKQKSLPGEFGKNAATMLVSAKQKLLYFGLTEKQISQIIQSNDQSPNTTFYSTYSGYITEILNTEGSYLMEGSGILKIANLQSLWLETQVNVNYASRLRIGRSTSVSFVDFPSKKFNGRISFINPEINGSSRLLLVRMDIPNIDLKLKPGMQGSVEIQQANIKGMFLPIDAVIQEQNAAYIWVEKEKGIYLNKMVKLGKETDGLIEISSGLELGDKVVISGAYAINSEYRFRKGANPMAGMDM